ncbi:hypothetical protein HZH68_012613 [Vespula germanica]|uniref:Uncharacterized protein n=1 Tax=Vespula germanica TaxID=30212 RepID=A0A834JHS6_VESGE|nr:hypothetical protein HZH68_012613 [Vespula germanica]
MPIDPQKITRVKGLLVRVGLRICDQHTRYILNTCKHAILPGQVQTVLQYNRSKRWCKRSGTCVKLHLNDKGIGDNAVRLGETLLFRLQKSDKCSVGISRRL